jgi:hypothetical protein
MNFFPAFCAVAKLAAGILTCAAVAREQDLLGQADIQDLVPVLFVDPWVQRISSPASGG